MIEIVPATVEHLHAMGMEMPRTVRAIAAVGGGLVLGVAGLYSDTNRSVAFVKVSKEIDKRTVVRASRILMRWILESRAPVHAARDFEIESSGRFLRHYGFVPVTDKVYVCLAA